jgi:lysophospholipid acyltransferase (LPLAT)-like uncharacterized protein
MSDPAPPLQKGKQKRSGVIVPHRPQWHDEIAAAAIWAAGKALSATLRLEVEDRTAIPLDFRGPLIAAVWHNRLALAMPIWKIWRKRCFDARLAALISASRDGALLARTFSYFGVKAVRGSSSRRGAQALLELSSALREGYYVAITPDGPRGPKYQVQPGIIALAQLTGVPIVPVGVYIERKKALRSWDAFQIPLPFTRCHATLGAPIEVPKEATPEEAEQARSTLERALLELSRD